MKVEGLLLLSASLAIGNAAGIPKELEARNDVEFVTVTEYFDCAVTSLVYETMTYGGVPTTIPTLVPISQLPDGQNQGPWGYSGPSGISQPAPSTAATGVNSPPTNSPSNCANGPESRKCWDNCTIDTNPVTTWPVTGVIREVRLTQFLS
jgi:hypothetical protein